MLSGVPEQLFWYIARGSIFDGIRAQTKRDTVDGGRSHGGLDVASLEQLIQQLQWPVQFHLK